MKRRELFSSLVSSFKQEEKQEKIIRPPYYKSEDVFFSNCKDCEGVCAAVCEENIIFIQEDFSPKVDLKVGGCTYCNACATACPNEVLHIEHKKNISAKIEIDVLSCLSWNKTMCFSCKDPCLDDAIDFLAMFRPSINDKCTSCGFCINSCPTNAIKIIN